MSKRLKAPRYQRMIKFLEEVMENPKETGRTRMMAALRLDDLYARLDIEDNKVAAHKRRLELRELQVATPTLPLPDPEPVEPVSDKTKEAFSFLKTGGDNATVQSDS